MPRGGAHPANPFLTDSLRTSGRRRGPAGLARPRLHRPPSSTTIRPLHCTPWSYAFDPETDTLFVNGSGALTHAELLTGVGHAMRDPNFHPDVRLFDDFSQLAGFAVAGNFLSPLLHPHGSKRLRGRHALLLPPSTDPAGLDLKAVRSSRSRAFTSREAALDWLNEGVPVEKFISAARAEALLAAPRHTR